MSDTIYAVSSGAPPAAIAIIRISGPGAEEVARALGGSVPEPRRAVLRRLRDSGGATLDHALVLWFPGPDSATGEDVVELHVHGGRAVIAAVERAVAAVPGTRRAEPGEFTRRALMAGRIDVAQASGLADLLEAETETQRRAALAASDGALTREVRGWLDRLSDVRAQLEAAIDYDEEGDLPAGTEAFRVALTLLAADLDARIAAPTSERVREGWRVVIAGPPNAGKSSLFNAMLQREAAIVAPIAGTTRDRVEAKVVREGQVFTLVDTAGLAEFTADPIEAEGIRRAGESVATADLVLWLADDAPQGLASVLWLRSRCDQAGRNCAGEWDLTVSALRPATIDTLWTRVAAHVSKRLPIPEGFLLHAYQRDRLILARDEISRAETTSDSLVQAEHLRAAAQALAQVTGGDHTEAMLNALFARLCVGK